MRFDSQSGSTGRVMVARLYPGEDLLTGIGEACKKHGIKYGIITSAVLISGQGLVCENRDGTMDVHLHAVMRDNKGNVYGSHIPAGGNIAQYTIDVAVIEVNDMRLMRLWDEETQHFQTKPLPIA